MTAKSAAIAYLVNQYPKVSHSFIRREIQAVEKQGFQVLRFSIRSRADELVDPADLAELEKTRFLLAAGLVTILGAIVQTTILHPGKGLQALILAIKLGWRSERGTLRHLAYWAEACVLRQWLVKAQVQHLHTHFGTNAVTVALLCAVLGGPAYSFTVHGPEEFDKAQLIQLPIKINQAAFIIAISEFGRSQLYRYCTAEQWSKIHVVHCGLDQHFLGERCQPIPPDPKLVCVGRLCADKGQLLLLEAIRDLVAEGLDLQLVLVGDGELRPLVADRIQAFQLQDQIEITGWATADQVKAYMQAAQVLILPSFAEGLPVVLMEALALGRPVISTYIAGIPELVEPEKSGWLVPAGAIAPLKEAIRQALATPVTQLEMMGQHGSKQVAINHDIGHEAQKLTTLFHQAISKS